jgi:hypothetical protein
VCTVCEGTGRVIYVAAEDGYHAERFDHAQHVG